MYSEIEKCLSVLHSGGTLLYPTDTIWGIGCDATKAEAVEDIFNLKKRPGSKSLIILLDDPGKLDQYMETLPELAFDLICYAEKPLTIVYPNGRNLADNVYAEDGSIAIRIVKPGFFAHDLVQAFGKPIISTSANISGAPNPLTYRDITPEIIDGVDHVVPESYCRIDAIKASAIIKLNLNGEFTIIRS